MTIIAGILAALFLLLLLFLQGKLWLEGRKERTSPTEITGDDLSGEKRTTLLRPLEYLRDCYAARDLSRVDDCIAETMQTDGLLILGTNPWEVFTGREGAARLLYGDWKYWGRLMLDTAHTALYERKDAAYFVLRGSIKLHFCRFCVPIKMTGMLEKQDGVWRIAKLQFVNDLNTNHVIISWAVELALVISLLLFCLALLLHI